MRIHVTLLLLALAAVAGCAAPVPPASPATEAAVAAAPFPFVRMTDCDGLLFHVPLPADAVRDHVPDAFRLSGFLPGTADLIVEAYRCGRTEAPTHVGDDAWLLWSSVKVRSVNEAWADADFERYTLDVFASPDLAADLQRAGVPARPGDLASRDESHASVTALRAWTVRDAAAGFELAWAHATLTGTPFVPNGENHTRHHWVGDGPYHRYDLDYQSQFYEAADQAPGRLVPSGDTATLALLGATPAPARALALDTAAWDLTIQPRTFDVEPLGEPA